MKKLVLLIQKEIIHDDYMKENFISKYSLPK